MAESRPEYAAAGLVAVLTPQANFTVEAEMAVLLPRGCGSITARLTGSRADSRQRLLQYYERVEATLDTLGNAAPQAALFACTGSSYLVGREPEAACFRELSARRGYPIVSAAQAIAAALGALRAKRIALVSPYPGWLTDACAGFWREQGIEVVQVASPEGDRSDTTRIYALGSRDATAAIRTLDLARADAVLISGTGMPSLGAIAAPGSPLPVLSSNLCLAWRAAQIVGAGPAELPAWLGVRAWWRDALAARFPGSIAR